MDEIIMRETETFEKINWPGGAKCAVMLSFDVDGDTIWKNGARDIPGGGEFLIFWKVVKFRQLFLFLPK